MKDAADGKFNDLRSAPDTKLRPLKKLQSVGGKGKKPKVAYQSEETCNAEIAKETAHLLLDQRLIRIDEVPGPGIEACDLLDIDGWRFIPAHLRRNPFVAHSFKPPHVLQLVGRVEARAAIARRKTGVTALVAPPP